MKLRSLVPWVAGAANAAVALVVLTSRPPGSIPPLTTCAALFAGLAAAGLVSVSLTLKVGRWRGTLVPLVVVTALLAIGPLPAVAATLLAALFVGAARTRSLRRTAVHVTMAMGPVGAAAMVFTVLGGSGVITGASTAASLAAGVMFSAVEWLNGSVVGQRFDPSESPQSLPIAGGVGLVCAATGLAFAALEVSAPGAPALVAPLIAAVVIGARHLARLQADHDRLDRLATASARTTGLRSFEAAVAQAAGEAGALVGGAVALSMAMAEDNTVVCSVVGAAGVRPASPDLIADLMAWVGRGRSGEVAAVDLPAGVRALCPTALSVVTAGGLVDGHPGTLAVIVLREAPPDHDGSSRAQLLEAFVGHAALIATNALLFQRVEEALRDQVDMNRQKDEFLAAVSHELRTPLASMLGSVETLRRLDGRMTGEARDRFFSIAHRQGKRLQRLIEELLLTASLDHRQEVVVASACRLSEVFDEVTVDLLDQASGRIVAHCDPDADVVWTDPNKLRQVVTNLVDNATKYAPEGPIELLAVARGSHLEIRVVDHGPGIAVNDRNRAFERFVQLDGSSTRAQGGTGLGLYLCRRVAELLEGELTLLETPGGGATFVLSMPRSHSATRATEPEGGPGGRGTFSPNDRFGAGPYLDRALLDLRRGPSSGPAAGLAARPVVPAALVPPGGPTG